MIKLEQILAPALAFVLGAADASADAVAAEKVYRRSTLEIGANAAYWQLTNVGSAGFELQARASWKRVAGIQVGYTHVALNEDHIPARGYATPPDVHAELFLAPIPNPYFSPYLLAGAGIATYADNRVSILAGGGVEIAALPWLTFMAEWRLVLPNPGDAADAIEERAETLALTTAKGDMNVEIPSTQQVITEYYNFETYEIIAGARFVY